MKRNNKILRLTFLILFIGVSMFLLLNCTPNAQSDNNQTSQESQQATIGNTAVETTDNGFDTIVNVKVEKATELTDRDFHNTIKTGVVLVDFWASWCAPCRIQGPIVDELAKEMSSKAVVSKLNVDQYNAISAEYGVRNIPTIIIFKNGRETKRFVGVQTKEYLTQEINSLL
ncbi:MAG: thioredoxin [Bacteroidales bacterium]|nr:thioredoxin [Bacteroidales bacterium]